MSKAFSEAMAIVVSTTTRAGRMVGTVTLLEQLEPGRAVDLRGLDDVVRARP